MRLRISALVFLAIAGWTCKKNDHNEPVNPPPTNTDYIAIENSRLSAAVTGADVTAYVSGAVVDEEGKPLAAVSITAGDTTIKTNDKGLFQFPHTIKLNRDYAVLTASLDGYFKAIKTFTPGASGKTSGYIEVKLLKKGTAKTVAPTGGDIIVDSNVNLVFPASAVATSNGTAYTGDYKVYARYIDPSAADFFETMPGLLAGLNEQNQLRALRSLGMAVVEITDNAGNNLQIAPGKKVTMKLPAASDGPATVPLWHFNEKYGLWIQAGTATRNGNLYVADVDHFSTWNLDLDFNSYKLTVQFKDANGNNLTGLKVQAYTESQNKIVSFVTDDQGSAILINCPASEPLIFKSVFSCDTLVTQLSPLSADRTETITLHPDPSKIKTFSVSGKITGCDDAALVNQPFQVYFESAGIGKGIPMVTDEQGNYSATTALCTSVTTATVQALALINNEYHYAPSSHVNTGSNIYNARICDSTVTIPDNFIVTFADHVLDSLVRVKIGKATGSILYGDVKNIDSLDNQNMVIHDIAGIEYCTNLHTLSIGYADLTNLNPLKDLKQLTDLELVSVNNKGLSDLSPLQGLVNLQWLALTSDDIIDITPLKNLTSLTDLSIGSNGLTDLSPLSTLTNLESLYLGGDKLTDISVLRNMTKLDFFEMSAENVTNLQPLQSLTKLTTLRLARNNNISDISPLQSLVNLQSLDLEENKVTDITPLQNLVKLQLLNIMQNQVTDLTPVQNMTELQDLYVKYNKIATVPSLNKLTKLIYLFAGDNLITDISGMQQLNALQELDLVDNNITDISPLTNGVPALQSLGISGQSGGPFSQAQKDAFTAKHPGVDVVWD